MEITPLIKFTSIANKMNLHAFSLLVHPDLFNMIEVIVLFWLFFIAQGFCCSTSSIKRFGGRDSLFGRAAILNFGHTEQAQ